jgi:hypothetical protein
MNAEPCHTGCNILYIAVVISHGGGYRAPARNIEIVYLKGPVPVLVAVGEGNDARWGVTK